MNTTELKNANFKNAFSVSFTMEGKSWETKTFLIETDTKENAFTIAQERARESKPDFDGNDYQIKIEPLKVYGSAAKLVNSAYPYGYKTTNAFFSLESNKKGFRSIFQTENPKTGRINNPKKSTYSTIVLMVVNENGFVSNWSMNPNSFQAINKALYFVNDFYELFAVEELKQIFAELLMLSKVSVTASVAYTGAKFEDLKPEIEYQVKKLIENYKEPKKENVLQSIFNVQNINSHSIKDFNPFKTTVTIPL